MIQTAWNTVSVEYQENHFFPAHSVSYGPWSPLEEELNLLGDVANQQIVEIGCGGGQNCLVLAQQGAQVTGLDISTQQLALARQLAEQASVSIDLSEANAEDLSTWPSDRWDLILSVYTLQYIKNIEGTLREFNRLLRQHGTLVFSFDHPLRTCFVDEEDDELVVYPTRSYFDASPITITFSQSQTRISSYHRTVAQWVQLLQNAGFCLRQLHEPAVPTAIANEFWPIDSPLSPLRHLPHTAIFVAEKE